MHTRTHAHLRNARMQVVAHSVAEQVTSLQAVEQTLQTFITLEIKYREVIDSGNPEDEGRLAQQLKDGKPLMHAFSLALRSLNEGLRLQYFFLRATLFDHLNES